MDGITLVYVERLEEWVVMMIPKVGVSIGLVILGLFASVILKFLLTKFEQKIVKRTETSFDDIVFLKLNIVIMRVFYSIVAMMAFEVLGIDATSVIVAILAMVLAGPISEIINEIMYFFEKGFIPKTDSQFDDVVFPLLRKTVVFTVYIFAIIISLDELGIEIVPFVAGLGIAGIAIGFAAKDTFANVIAGIFIIIDRPFVIGDRIELWTPPKDGATWGDVFEIGLRTIKIKTPDNIILIIPNSEIYKRDIINYTTGTPKIRVRLPVGISYSSNMRTAEGIMMDVAREIEGVEGEPAVLFKGFGESSIDFEVRVWVMDAKTRAKVKSQLGIRIKDEFDKAGIEIPYPQRDVHLKEARRD